MVFTATDDAGGSAVSSSARATISVRLGSAGATDAAAVDAGAAAVRAFGSGGIDAVLARPAEGGGGSAGLAALEMLATKKNELESGEIDLREFLDGQSVSLPLSQTGGAGGVDVGAWLQASGGEVGGVVKDRIEDGAVYTDGEFFSTNFGIDARLGSLLAGVGYGLHSTTADYGFEELRGEDAASKYELELGALQPYVAYDFGGTRLAGALGFGSGELVLKPADEAERKHDVEYVGYALGVAHRQPAPGGAGEVRLRGSYAGGELDVAEPAGSAASLDSSGSVLRLAAGYERALDVGGDAVVTPSVEAGYLLLGGDGAVENSALLAGGLAYASGPLHASGSYQHALADEVTLSGYELSFRYSTGLGGLGLGLEADPGYGLAGVEKMLDGTGRGAFPGAGGREGRRPARRRRAELRPGGGRRGAYAVTGAGAWRRGSELGLRLRAGERHAWALGYGAAAQQLRIEYRLGE